MVCLGLLMLGMAIIGILMILNGVGKLAETATKLKK